MKRLPPVTSSSTILATVTLPIRHFIASISTGADKPYRAGIDRGHRESLASALLPYSVLDLLREREMLERQPEMEDFMASPIAHRRAAKAARRKQVLASRRAAEPVSLADKVRRATVWPLHRCLLHDD